MPKQKKPKHASGLVEHKATMGKTIDGKRIQKSFYGSSKQEAKRKADEYILQQKIAEQTGEMFIKKSYTFAEWAKKWLEVYKKPNVSENTYLFTYENTVNKHLIPYFGKASLSDIKNIDIQAFFKTKSKLSETMQEKMLLCLRGIFESAIDNDICYKNPAKKATYTSNATKHTKQVYTSEQIDTIKSASYGKMNEIVLLLETGLRRVELLGLMWSDIDFDKGVLSVNRSIADSKTTATKIKINPPKWNSYRDIPLKENSIKILKSIIRNSDYIFPKIDKLPQSPSTWSQKLKRFMETMPDDFPRLTAHELRHTYGTDLRRQGIDIYTIQKVMGHKDIKMTSELYVHNEIEEIKKALKL